jgi:hypothetical protein
MELTSSILVSPPKAPVELFIKVQCEEEATEGLYSYKAPVPVAAPVNVPA